MRQIKIVHVQDKENRKITLAEEQEPKLERPDQVKLRVLAVGLDGTDHEILSEGYGEPPEGSEDLTNGHEMLGVVVEAGKDSGFRPGELVTSIVRRPCREPGCVNCRNGRPDFCQTGKYTERGIKRQNGYLREFAVEPAQDMVRIPPKLLPIGMFAEPQSIVEKVWDEIHYIQQRLIWEPRTALVLGSGPLGLLAAFTCRTFGLDTYVYSLSEPDSLEAQLVRETGAVYKKSEKDEPLKAYADTLGRPIDLIFECTGFSPLAFDAMDVLDSNGLLALLGVSAGDRKVCLTADKLNLEIVLQNKCIVGSVNASRKHFETGLYRLEQMENQFPGLVGRIATNLLKLEDLTSLDFKKIGLKAVVDLVPRGQWEELAKQAEEMNYSFSV